MASRSDRLALLTKLAQTTRGGIARATPVRQFGRLRESFRFIVTGKGVVIYSTYYWARFANDGRRRISLPQNQIMMFFRDPADDPRVQDDYPRKRATRRRLTKQELRDAKERDEIIITRDVASAKPLKFIQQGVALARKEVPKEVLSRIQGDVRRLLRRKTDKITVRL